LQNVPFFWDSVRALALMISGRDDVRPWAALSRMARSIQDSAASPAARKASVLAACGALEGFFASEGWQEHPEEIDFALETARRIQDPPAPPLTLKGGLSVAKGLRRTADMDWARETDWNLAGVKGPERSRATSLGWGWQFDWCRDADRPCDWDLETETRFLVALRSVRDKATLAAGEPGGREAEDAGSGLLSAVGTLAAAAWRIPGAPGRRLDPEARGWSGTPRSLDHIIDVWSDREWSYAQPDHSGPLRRALAEAEDGSMFTEPSRIPVLRSKLGHAVAYDIASLAATGGVRRTAEADGLRDWDGIPDVRGRGEGGEPVPGSLSEARMLLSGASEALDRLDPMSDDALDAKLRLMQFLLNESGPPVVMRLLPEELPPEQDLKRALEIARGLSAAFKAMDTASYGDEFVFVNEGRLSLAVFEAKCLKGLGDAAGAARILRNIGLEEGVNPEPSEKEPPDSHISVGYRFALADSARDAGRLGRSLLMHSQVQRAREICYWAGNRLRLQAVLRVAELRNETGEIMQSAGIRARAAETLETFWPLEPAVPELRLTAAADLLVCGGTPELLGLMKRWAGEMERLMGPGHPRVVRAAWLLSKSCLSAGDFAAAEAGFRKVTDAIEAFPARAARPGGAFLDGALLVSAMHSLALAKEGLGDFSGAASAYAREREIRSSRGETDSPDELMALFREAQAIRAAGDLAGALALHRKALEARLQLLGKSHPDTLESLLAVKELGGPE
jgi:hypothetical protein